MDTGVPQPRPVVWVTLLLDLPPGRESHGEQRRGLAEALHLYLDQEDRGSTGRTRRIGGSRSREGGNQAARVRPGLGGFWMHREV